MVNRNLGMDGYLATVPFSVLGLCLGGWAVLKETAENRKTTDFKGICLYISGMAAVVLLLNPSSIHENRWVVMLILLFIFVASLTAFLYVERKQQDPILDLTLFKIRNFSLCTCAAALNYLCFFLVLFLLPFYFDNILHFSPLKIGIYLTVTPLVMTVSAPIAGALSDRIGIRILTVFGMIFSTAALLLFCAMCLIFQTDLNWMLIMGLILTGLGTGTFAAANNSAILGTAPRSQQGMASGILATVRYVGMMAGITIGGTLLNLLMGGFASEHHRAMQSFLTAFSVGMGIGFLFGILGILCSAKAGDVPK